MSIANGNINEVELERQSALADMREENGEEWAQNFRPGSLGCHELWDRTSLIAGLIEDQLLAHPACIGNERCTPWPTKRLHRFTNFTSKSAPLTWGTKA